eukprot:1144953-Pelagomonas_calceolata.AAC.2
MPEATTSNATYAASAVQCVADATAPSVASFPTTVPAAIFAVAICKWSCPVMPHILYRMACAVFTVLGKQVLLVQCPRCAVFLHVQAFAPSTNGSSSTQDVCLQLLHRGMSLVLGFKLCMNGQIKKWMNSDLILFPFTEAACLYLTAMDGWMDGWMNG